MKRVVVVGGGIVGLCAAYYARKEEFEVTVIEREPEAHHGCSWGNAGLIVPSHFVPLAAPGMVVTGMKMMLNPRGPLAFNLLGDRSLVKWARSFARYSTKTHVDRSAPLLRDLNLLSRTCYEEFQEEFEGAFGYHRTGLLIHCLKKVTLNHEAHTVEVAKGMGLEAKILDEAGLKEYETGVETKAVGAAYFADDGYLTPGLFLDRLTSRLKEMGVHFEFGTRVTGWAVAHGHVVAAKTQWGEIEGDEFVLAGGSWSRELAEAFGLHLPMVPGKGYSMTVEGAPATPKYPALLVEARVAVTPMSDGVRFAGTMELGSWNSKVSAGRLTGIKRAVPKYWPQFGNGVLERAGEVWSGLRPCLPDGLPAIGRVGGSNVMVATGHAMMGLSLGPGTGRLVADVLAGRKPALPVHALSPERFGK